MKYIVLIFLFCCQFLHAQASYDKVILMDSLQKPTNSNDFFFKKIIKKYNIPADNYKFLVYNKFNKKIKEGFYLDKDGEDYDGELILYYENGSKKQSINYQKGERIGKFSAWNEDGTLREEGQFFNRHTTAISYKINNFWDPNNVQLVTNGNGFYVKKDSISENKGEFKNGFKHGKWTKKYYNNNTVVEEQYDNGRFISGDKTSGDGEKIPYDSIESKPIPPDGINAFYQYLAQNFNQNTNFEFNYSKATFKVSFIIDKEGKIVEPKIIKGMNKRLNDEIIRVLLNAKPWTPGMQNGLPVRVQYMLPIEINF